MQRCRDNFDYDLKHLNQFIRLPKRFKLFNAQFGSAAGRGGGWKISYQLRIVKIIFFFFISNIER